MCIDMWEVFNNIQSDFHDEQICLIWQMQTGIWDEFCWNSWKFTTYISARIAYRGKSQMSSNDLEHKHIYLRNNSTDPILLNDL